MDAFLAIASRREVRDYEPRALPPEVDERILDAGPKLVRRLEPYA